MPDTFLLHTAQIGSAFQMAGGASQAAQIGHMQRDSAHNSPSHVAISARPRVVRNVVSRLGTKRTRPSYCRGMAAIAIIRRRNMTRILAHSLNTIVTGRTQAGRIV